MAYSQVQGQEPESKSYDSHEFDLKTNLLTDIVGTMDIAGEARLSRRVSMDIDLLWNPWTFKDGLKYKQWQVMPELRWWFPHDGEESTVFNGHFLGVHIYGGEFNFNRIRLPFNAAPALRGQRFQGWYVGGGISYGYRWNFSRRVAMEGVIGVGVAHTDYDRYKCTKCGERVGSGSRLYVGPTKLQLNLIIRLGHNPDMKRKVEYRPAPCDPVHDTVWITRVDTVRTTDIIEHRDSTALRVRQAKFTLHLRYPLDSSAIQYDLGDNRSQIDSLNAFLDRYADNPDIHIRSIDIIGFASIEGEAEHNLNLSRARAQAAAALIARDHPELNHFINAIGRGEDWTSISFPGKERLMEIHNENERERMLRRIDNGRLFNELLRTQLPQTRRIECLVNFSDITTETIHIN